MAQSRGDTTDTAPAAPPHAGSSAPVRPPHNQVTIQPPASRVTELAPRVEALLISVDRPLPALRIAEAVGLLPRTEESDAAPLPSGKDQANAAKLVGEVVRNLNDQYTQSGRAFRVEEVSAGYRVMTLPAFAGVVTDFHRSRQQSRLSRAAVETLAIVAYRQPMTRAELESIRGVSCGEVLKTLLERRMLTIKGRAEELGRPMLYGTTRQFLDAFGLSSIKDLPAPADLKI